MKMHFIISMVILFFAASFVNAQGPWAQIENYGKVSKKGTIVKAEVSNKELKADIYINPEVKVPSSSTESVQQNQSLTKYNSIKKKNTPKPITTNSTSIDEKVIGLSTLTSAEELDTLSSPTKNILFKESFSHKTLDNLWLKDSDTKNMMGFESPSHGKVLKISNKYPRSSLIEYYLDDSFKGKNLILECKIKTEDIMQGTERFHVGQCAIEYQVGEIFVYPVVQGLISTKDWDTYYAREDGNTKLDDTDMGHYVFTIPQNAKNIRLYLGLQNCTGTIYFKDLLIYELLR